MREEKQFDRLTPQARRVLSLAQEEAQRFNHNYIGTEHLLLGLVRMEEGVSATVLTNLGVDVNRVRSAVEFIIGRGDRIVLGDIGLTPRSKKILELALDEARHLNQEQVGTEHLLLGLVRESEGIAAGVLESLGVNLWKVRQETLRVLGLPPDKDEPPEAPRDVESMQRVQHSSIFQRASGFAAGAPTPPMLPITAQFSPLQHYRPWHIDAEQHEKAAVGKGAERRMVFGPRFGDVQPGNAFGTLLGWVIVNTGGAFTLTLYDGLADDAPALAAISQPPTGACFPFHLFVRQGLAYTLEGTPGSATIIYDEVGEQRIAFGE
ncbi:MAG TPA: Clp protease N-terminal domain-containing protein [Ktedonobacterales bacterium]|jgi:hypothetical protein